MKLSASITRCLPTSDVAPGACSATQPFAAYRLPLLLIYLLPVLCIVIGAAQVMRYDLVPRFSTAAVEAMQQELLEIDYKGLLHDDLMEHEVSRV